MTKVNWISVKDRLPNHMDRVIAWNERGNYYVSIFADTKKVIEKLLQNDIPIPEHDDNEYEFCSIEMPGNCLRDVTHWMPSLEPPVVQL